MIPSISIQWINVMKNQDTTPNPPFWKTDWGKNALIVLAIILIYPFIHSWLIQEAAKGPAPDFQARSISNKIVNLNDYQGQPVLMHFWATWCEVCEYERPDIEKLAKEYPVINIAIQSGSDQEVLAFAQKNGMNPDTIINDQNDPLKNLYSVHAVPASFVVDAAGQIQFVKHGYSNYKTLKEHLESSK